MLHKICKDIMILADVNKFIETGTHLGQTLAEVSEWFQNVGPDFGIITGKTTDPAIEKFVRSGQKIYYPIFKNSKETSRIKLYSVDLDEKKQKILQNIFKNNPNIKPIYQSSEKFIREMIESGQITDADNCFFYLDAHGNEYWPLRDEIREILKLKHSIICIDDFVVPFQPETGFDVYGHKICNWYYIKDLFKKRKIALFYPKRPDMDNRGKVIIFVGYDKNDLIFMNSLPCFRPFFKGDLYLTTLKVRLIHSKLYPLIKNTKIYFFIRNRVLKKIGIS